MTVVRFTSYPDGYRCNRPGEMAGEYVPRAEADALAAERDTLQSRVYDAAARIDLLMICKRDHPVLCEDLQMTRREVDRVTAERDELAAKVAGLQDELAAALRDAADAENLFSEVCEGGAE